MQIETSYPKDKIKILLLEGIHQSAIDTFKAADYHNIELLPKALPEEQLIEKIKDISLVGIRSKTQMNARVIAAAKKLRAIACFCIGTNQVDLEAAKEKGIRYFLISFTDLFGVVRSKLVPAAAIAGMQKNGAGFAGFATWLDMSPADSDMFAFPDPDSLIQLPWNKEVGWLSSDLWMNGKPVEASPRVTIISVTGNPLSPIVKSPAAYVFTNASGCELPLPLLSV